MADDTSVNQDVQTTASPTFAGLDLTEGNITNGGSIAIDAELMAAADILPYESVLIADLTNGSRLET